MRERHPSAEERRLWQAINRETVRLTDALAPTLETPPGADSWEAERSALSPLRTLPHAPAALGAPMPSRRHAPTPPPLALLSAREAKKRFDRYPIDAVLDLHGDSQGHAYERVQQFIAHQARAGHRHLLIITGKGKGDAPGILRTRLPQWLDEPGLRRLIGAIAHARPEKGGTGVLHVLLKA